MNLVLNRSTTDVEFRVDLEDLYNFYNVKYLNDKCSAPTQSLLQRWLREVYDLDVNVWCNASGWGFDINKTCGTSIYQYDINNNFKESIPYSGMFKNYEKALEEGLKQSLKRILNEKE